MKYNFNKTFVNNCFLNLIKFGKIKSNYFKLKRNKKKIYFCINSFFNKKKKIYLIKIKYKKGDCSILGEMGIFDYYHNNFLKNE